MAEPRRSLRERMAGNKPPAEEVVSGTVDEVTEALADVNDLDQLDEIERAEEEGQKRVGVQQAIEKRRADLESESGVTVVTPGEPLGDLGAVQPTQNTQLLTTTDDLEREVRVGRLTPEQAGRPDLRGAEPLSREHEFLSAEVAGARSDADQPAAVEVTLDPEGAIEDDLSKAFRWAMRQLMHPAEQNRTCPQHGRVPMTHMCSVFSDANYANAIRLLNEVGAS